MDSLISFLKIAIPIVLLGGGLVALSRWSRARNAEVRREGPSSAAEAPKAFAEGNFAKFVRLSFFGDSPALVQKLGRFLAVGVILSVAIFFVWLGVMLGLRALR